MRDHRLTTALLGAAAALLLAGAPAGAQPVRPEPAPDSAPNNPNAAPPEKVAPPLRTPEAGQNSGSSGVIVPPAGVDPGITAPPPNPGTDSRMPVVPPPGTRGNPGPTPK